MGRRSPGRVWKKICCTHSSARRSRGPDERCLRVASLTSPDQRQPRHPGAAPAAGATPRESAIRRLQPHGHAKFCPCTMRLSMPLIYRFSSRSSGAGGAGGDASKT